MSGNQGPASGFHSRDRDWYAPAFTPAYKTSILRSPKQPLISIKSTINENTGPMFGHEIIGELDNDLVANYSSDGGEPVGERIIVHGKIKDENGRGVPNCLLEFWQANAGGRYRHKNDSYLAALDPNFGGCGRTITDDQGHYQFFTVKPGPYPWPNGPNEWRPSHIHFSIFGHAFAQRLITQMYFEGDPLIERCAIVNTLPSKEAIDTLIAPLDMSRSKPMDALAYRFNIVLRGQQTTFIENQVG